MVLSTLRNKFNSDITETPLILQQKHYPSLDGLRGICIMFTIGDHLFFGTKTGEYIDGRIGLQIFFLISGFLITTLILKEKVKRGKASLKSFYIRRVLRIFPVAILYLLCLIILNFIFRLGVTGLSFATAFLYLKNIPIPHGSEWYTIHYWSLCVEEQFYLIFPFILLFNQKLYVKIIIALIIFIPLLDFLGREGIGIFNTNHYIHSLAFIVLILLGQGTVSILIGSLFSIMLFKKIISFDNVKTGYFFSFILFVVAVIIDMKPLPFYIPYLSPVIFTIMVGFVVIINLKPDNFFFKLLNTPILTKIGIISYSLYVWQQIFIHQQPWATSFKYADSPFLNIPALFLVAYLSYNFYEKKFLKLKNRFEKN